METTDLKNLDALRRAKEVAAARLSGAQHLIHQLCCDDQLSNRQYEAASALCVPLQAAANETRAAYNAAFVEKYPASADTSAAAVSTHPALATA
jgi:hypothetical protein